MLKQKPKVCAVCNKERIIWSKGMCKMCATIHSPTKLSAKGLKRSSAKLTRRPLKKTFKGKSEAVKNFYSKLILDLSDQAMSIESGVILTNLGAVNLAHILPKATFPSVGTEKSNIVLLTWEEHTRFDELLGRHEFEKLEQEFPNSWGKICDKVRLLLPKVTEQKPLKFKFEQYLNGV